VEDRNTWNGKGQYSITNHHAGAKENKYQEKSLEKLATLQFLLQIRPVVVMVHNKGGQLLICAMLIWQRTNTAMSTKQWV
jgi:hypothetical protein